MALALFVQGCATTRTDDAAAPLTTVTDSAFDAQTNFHYRPLAVTAAAPVESRSTFSIPATTTVWNRLDEYRSHDNVQVLTLWQSRRFMFSIQSGKHGETALRWGSKSLNRGEAKRGLLDGMFHDNESQ
jgi:hypothetical protein